MIDAEPLEPRPEEGRRKAGMRRARIGEAGPHIGVDIGDAVLLGDAGEVSSSLNLAGLVKCGQGAVGGLLEGLEAAVGDRSP